MKGQCFELVWRWKIEKLELMKDRRGCMTAGYEAGELGRKPVLDSVLFRQKATRLKPQSDAKLLGSCELR